MIYTLIKLVHVGSVALSFSLFFVRGIWMLRAPQRLQRRWVRIAPHIVDSILLTSALILAVMSRQYPGVENWLTAKVIALLVYIALGMIALKRGRSRRVRTLAWLAALTVFVYIIAVAVTRDPWLV